MGWIEIRNIETGKVEVLGDKDQYRKANGLPYYKDMHGNIVTQEELDEIDKAGE